VWLPVRLLAEMSDHAGEHLPNETGGMLLGWRLEEQIVIVALVQAGPRAKHARDRFHPDGAWQQRNLADIYHESGRTITYLGDWHSHPRGPRRPSGADRETAAKVAAEPDARVPEPLTVIVARRRRRFTAHPYLYSGGELRRLRLCVHGQKFAGHRPRRND
jgi:integrative and conjugative element protein (TIGR02256 family)